MYPNNDKHILYLDDFTSLKGVIDVIFNPLRSNLILKAKQNNINCCSGLFMLVAQAFYAIEIFLDTKIISFAFKSFKTLYDVFEVPPVPKIIAFLLLTSILK